MSIARSVFPFDFPAQPCLRCHLPLDIEAAVTAEIAEPVDASAAVSLNVTDLGSAVTGDLIGNRLHITSAPATGSLAIQASGRVQ